MICKHQYSPLPNTERTVEEGYRQWLTYQTFYCSKCLKIIEITIKTNRNGEISVP